MPSFEGKNYDTKKLKEVWINIRKPNRAKKNTKHKANKHLSSFVFKPIMTVEVENRDSITFAELATLIKKSKFYLHNGKYNIFGRVKKGSIVNMKVRDMPRIYKGGQFTAPTHHILFKEGVPKVIPTSKTPDIKRVLN